MREKNVLALDSRKMREMIVEIKFHDWHSRKIKKLLARAGKISFQAQKILFWEIESVTVKMTGLDEELKFKVQQWNSKFVLQAS